MKKTLLILCALVCGTLAFAQDEQVEPAVYYGNLYVEVEGSESNTPDSQVTVEWDTTNSSQLDFILHDFAISIAGLDLNLGNVTVKNVNADTENEVGGMALISCTNDHEVTISNTTWSSFIGDISVEMTGAISEDDLYANMTITVDLALLGSSLGSYAITATFTSSGFSDYTWALSDGTWNGNNGTYGDGVEVYLSTAFGSGKILYETVKDLPAGTYVLTFYAVASSTSNRDVITNDAYGDNIARVYATAGGTTQTEDVTVIQQTSCTPSDYPYTFIVKVGDDGTLEYGLQNITTGGNWYVAQGVSLLFSGEAETRELEVGEVVEDEGDENHLSHYSITYTGSGTNGGLDYNTWSGESGMTQPYQQVWVGAGTSSLPVYLSDMTVNHYQIPLLPAGYYAVTVDARVLSELDNTISKESAYFTANGQKVDLVELASTDEDFTYGTATEHEVNGSYDIMAVVTEEGTLDIGFSITNATYNWISWKNLKVVYEGEELQYSIGEPQCSATSVVPGGQLTITFDDCVTPDTDETPVLSSGKSITVNGSAVDAELTTKGLTATVTITIPETIGYGETVTVVVPVGLLTWANYSAVISPTADVTFTLSTPPMADQAGVYLYSTHAEGFLSRGGEHNTIDSGTTFQSYGKIATTDPYGIPVDITFGDDGLATVKFLDSNLFLYAGGWAWTDGSEANAGKYLVKEVTTEDEETVYQFCYDGGDDSFLYVNDENYEWVANNGNLTGDNNLQGDITRTYWQIFTMAERDANKEAFVESQKAEIAEAVGATDLDTYIASLSQTDVTDMVTSAALAGSLSGWTETDYYTDNNGTYFTTGTWGTEIYQGDAKLVQTVEGLEEGIYKVTLQGFVRHGYADNIVNSGLDKYDLSIGFLQANDYQINLKPWATEADLTNLVPNGTGNVWGDNNDGTRTYANELYTYVGSDGSLELSINCPDVLYGGWMVFKNLTLTYYEDTSETIEWEMTDAGWGTLILPFDVEIPSGLTLYAGDALTLDEEESTITVGDAADAIEANVPYLVSGTANTYTFTGTPEEATTLTSGMLTGTLVDMTQDDFTADSGQYVLQNHTEGDEPEGLAFYPITGESTGVTLGAYHCYLTTTANVSALHLPGMSTGIVAVEGAEAEANGAIYDLSGRRVSKAVKGVYIQNGKKVLVK